MINISLIFVISLISSSLGHLLKCPDLKGVEHFNISSISSGIWYELNKLPIEIEDYDKCISYNNVPSGENSFKAISTFLPKDSPKYLEVDITLSTKEYNVVHATYMRNDNVHFNTSAKVIVQEDNYFVVYNCERDNTSNLPKEHAWVFSRTPRLSDESLTKINSLFKSILDPSKLITVDHSQCSPSNMY